jgi:F0F1-type ATP synthase gamma subunit
MMYEGISKFILIGENVLNFHTSDDEYYSEWFEELSEADGWVALVNFRQHVLEDMQSANIDQYFLLGGKLKTMAWRTYEPEGVFANVEAMVMRRLGA